MTWFKVDDNFTMHPKALAAGNAAVGLWVRCGSYTSAQNLDGFVPEFVVNSIGTRREIDKLVSVGLFHKVDGGYVLHDYLAYNPSRAKVLADREDGRLRKAQSRARHKSVTDVSHRDMTDGHGVTDVSVTRVSQRPDPTRPDPKTTTARKQPTERARNPLWDALTECFREPSTKSEKTNRGRIVRELSEANATADEVRSRVAEHARRGLRWTLTENALVTHWTELGEQQQTRPGEGRGHWEIRGVWNEDAQCNIQTRVWVSDGAA